MKYTRVLRLCDVSLTGECRGHQDSCDEADEVFGNHDISPNDNEDWGGVGCVSVNYFVVVCLGFEHLVSNGALTWRNIPTSC